MPGRLLLALALLLLLLLPLNKKNKMATSVSLLLFLSKILRFAAASILIVLAIGAGKSVYASFLNSLPWVRQRLAFHYNRVRHKVLVYVGREVEGKGNNAFLRFQGGADHRGKQSHFGGLDPISENDPYIDNNGRSNSIMGMGGSDGVGGDGSITDRRVLSTPTGLAFTTNIGSSMRSVLKCSWKIATSFVPHH